VWRSTGRAAGRQYRYTSAVTTKIERSGRAVHAALADLSPEEAERFQHEYRDALTHAADTFDLTEAESMLTRWWGIANIRANPSPTKNDGWSSACKPAKTSAGPHQQHGWLPKGSAAS